MGFYHQNLTTKLNLKMKYLKNFNYIYLFLVVAGLVSIGLYIKTTDLIRIARHVLMACFVFRGGK